MKDFAIAVNTVSICSDVWEMFFSQLKKHFPNQKTYVFTDKKEGLPDNVFPIIYDPEDSFRTQTLNCLKKIPEKYILYLNEDYILYGDVLIEEMMYCIDFLNEKNEISFVRLTKGVEYNEPEIKNKIYLMDNRNSFFFSQTAGIWRTRDFERIHEESEESGTAYRVVGPQLEIVANETCRRLNINGVFYYDGDIKRGKYHYDSKIFPYIATAIIKGKWNLREYKNELSILLKEYSINPKIRGSI